MGTVKVKNVSFYGAVNCPAIRLEDIEPGEVVEVSAALAKTLDADHFEVQKSAAEKAADRKAEKEAADKEAEEAKK
jgi:hypothetical protein